MSVHARIDSSGYIHLLWESNEDRNGHAAIFEVKYGKTSERAVKESREQSVEQLFADLESVALAVKGSELDTTEDPCEPSARCINDTKKRQLVTRSGLPRLRCCACHVHHKWAVQSTAADRDFFNTVLQQVCHFKVDVIAGDANSAAYKYDQKQEYQDLHDSSVAVMLREICNVRSMRVTHFNAGFTLIILPIIIRLSLTQQMTLIVALWLSFHMERQPYPES